MSLLILITLWILTLSIVAGLCFAARVGDQQTLAGLPAAAERTGPAEVLVPTERPPVPSERPVPSEAPPRRREWRSERWQPDARAEAHVATRKTAA